MANPSSAQKGRVPRLLALLERTNLVFMAASERRLFFEGRPAFVYGRGGMVPAPDDARDRGAVGASALSPSPVVGRTPCVLLIRATW